jgi:hypothetical protein
LATVPTIFRVRNDPQPAGTVARPTNSRSFFFNQAGRFSCQQMGWNLNTET